MARLSKVLATVAAGAPVLAAAGAASTPALAATPHGGKNSPSTSCCNGGVTYYTWQNQFTGNYLHVVDNSAANSEPINTLEAEGSCAEHGVTDVRCSEEWEVLSTGYSGQYAYANVHSGLCLDDPNGDAGVQAIQYSCGAYPEQRRWFYGEAGGLAVPLSNNLDTAEGARYLCEEPGSAAVYVYSYQALFDLIYYSGYNMYLRCSWQ